MNIPSVLVLSAVILLAILAALHIARRRRSGDCASCDRYCPFRKDS